VPGKNLNSANLLNLRSLKTHSGDEESVWSRSVSAGTATSSGNTCSSDRSEEYVTLKRQGLHKFALQAHSHPYPSLHTFFAEDLLSALLLAKEDADLLLINLSGYAYARSQGSRKGCIQQERLVHALFRGARLIKIDLLIKSFEWLFDSPEWAAFEETCWEHVKDEQEKARYHRMSIADRIVHNLKKSNCYSESESEA
jgi:hypothetical protein